MSTQRRSLSNEERLVLNEVRAIWGPQNSEADVIFPKPDEAALFVKAPDGTLPICVSLSNLGRWHADGSLSLSELRDQIRGPASASESGSNAWTRLRALVARKLRRFLAARQ